jgi:hypothetical protein
MKERGMRFGAQDLEFPGYEPNNVAYMNDIRTNPLI